MTLQVGKISQYDSKTNRIWLELVLEYPFDFKKETEKDSSSFEQSDASPYGEDGSLEVKLLYFFSQLFYFCVVAYIIGGKLICPPW